MLQAPRAAAALQRCFRFTPRLLPLRRALSLAPSVAPSPLPLATTFPLGLTDASATEAHYSTALDLSSPLLLRDCAQDFMAAAREDAGSEPVGEHLARASSACEAFLLSEEACGREELRRELVGVLGQRGQLALLLGGRGVGKSLLLRELALAPFVGKDGVRRVVMLVNGRQSGTDLAAGIMDALERATLKRRADGSLLGARSSRPPAGAADAERLLYSLISKEGPYLCLVIDEGSLMLPPPLLPGEALVGVSSEEQQRLLRGTRALLHSLVSLTKDSRCINVLIATSEHDFPVRLQHGRFFNTANFTRTIVAGELPPARMRALLRSWGLGPRTADVFLAYLGGHVHLASQALDRLAATLDAFDILEVAPSLCAVGVDTCLREGGRGARGLLGALAGAGWATVEGPREAAVQALARENVGGFVDPSAVVVGVPAALRRSGGACGLGAVPSSHFMRHVIAHRLAVGWQGSGGGAQGLGASS